MGDHKEYPWVAEYAKSGRAGCKICKLNISKESLRIARMVQSPHFDGKMPMWHHFSCFWKKFKPESHLDIGGFNNLRWDDQTSIKSKISGGGDSGGSGSNKKSGGKSGKPEPLEEFAVEYAKSSRSSCKGCGEKIEKNDVRIAHRSESAAIAKGVPGPLALWHHVDCFKEPDKLEEVGWLPSFSGERLTGFSALKETDQDMLKKELTAKRKAADEADSGPSKPKKVKTGPSKEEKALKEQNDFVWKIRDSLFRKVSNTELRTLLEENDQETPGGESKLLDRVSDCMSFGILKPCPDCEGQLVVSAGTGYHCTGNLTAWTKCQHKSLEAKRGGFVIPAKLQKNEYLSTFKFKAFNKGVRVFPPDAVAEASTSGASAASSSKKSANKPLSGVKVALVGKLNKSNSELKKAVAKLGGEVVSTIDGTVACVISNEDEVEKMSKKIKEAKKHDVHVVSEDFLDAVKKGGAAMMITDNSIADWGADPHKRIAPDEADAPGPSHKSGPPKKSSLVSDREEKAYTKSVPKKMKMQLKGGGAVDPESGLADSAHILNEKGKKWTVTLGMVDIVRGTNSYYKLQLLESDSSSRYWLFRAWGRVGTTIGGNKLQKMGCKEDAKDEFKTLYLEKTGNRFGTTNFEKYPNKFYPLDIDYGDDEEKMAKMKAKTGATSKLAPQIQDLVQMIFDIDTLKKALVEFEIDLEKMPLGKLSRKQIEDAYKVLTELQKLVQDKANHNKLLDASNRFYTLIPHNFGMKNIPLLDDLDTIKTKTEMLDSLLEIEIAYSMLKADMDSEKDPLDAHYEQLKCPMEVLDHKSEEFQLIKEYTKNTHAATHSSYKLEVQEVFKLNREGEKSRYRPFKKLHNRQLLWHGSRLTNYAGILSQGLRIAPPEAPVTGYMFGKGVYFADMVSKSANYCHAYSSNPIGCMLLCEVALGNMYELTGAKHITKLPSGKHSTKGLGRTAPDSSGQKVLDDGVIVPKGAGTTSSAQGTSLLYNEYIVYDTAQIRMKYLIKMNFKYSTPW